MTILYSEAIFSFIKKSTTFLKEILSQEAQIEVRRSRFMINHTYYPIHIVTFEHPTKLGYFQADLYEIGINKAFLFEPDDSLKNVLRHELAHYLTYIEYGPSVQHHGKEFHDICKRYGWSAEISRASMQLDNHKNNEKLLSKIHKLFALANSPHLEEAQAATLKAQQLLMKYNLKLDSHEEEMQISRILPSKRSSSKLQAIAAILRTFLVYPVFNRGQGSIYLELLGEKVNVEVAEYVAYFLDKKFDEIWKETKKANPSLTGTVAKNTFFRGLAQGYLEQSTPSSNAIIQLHNQLVTSAERIYPHLTQRHRMLKHDRTAAKIGREKGKTLSIDPGLRHQSIMGRITHQ